MKKSILLTGLFLIFFFISNSHFLNAKVRTQPRMKSHPVYTKVTFIIPASIVKNWEDLYYNPSELLELNPDAIKRIPRLDEILNNLISRFNEGLFYYNKNKGKLPSCLREALDKFFADLKTGKKKLDIEWWKYKDIKWYELGSFLTDGFAAGYSRSGKLINVLIQPVGDNLSPVTIPVSDTAPAGT